MKFLPLIFGLALLACNRQKSIVVQHESGVHVIDSFYMPQLERYRNIWVYLPPDYQTSRKQYPVLYMHDGQNLFEDSTSFIGEWRIDETLDSFYQQGDYGCMVIGIENDGKHRMDEYMPHVHPKYGGGEGDLYIRFIIESLKPYVDSVYRTKPEAVFTGIGGSSLGGLISYYGAMNHPGVFGKTLVMSPSFWVDSDYVNWLAGGQYPTSYLVAGLHEGEGDVKAKIDSLHSIWNRHQYSDYIIRYPEDGEHSEWFWAREFGPGYQYLFSDLTNE